MSRAQELIRFCEAFSPFGIRAVDPNIRVGSRVDHEGFGKGIVKEIQGMDAFVEWDDKGITPDWVQLEDLSRA